MKVCIYGAGSIGGFLAAGLGRVEDVELSLVARGAHLQAIRSKGLKLIRDGAETVIEARASSDPAEFGPQDAVFNCLKAHQAWETAGHLAPLLGHETAVVTCQNGVPWWYFHGLGGPYAGRQLDAVDRGGRQWSAVGAHA